MTNIVKDPYITASILRPFQHFFFTRNIPNSTHQYINKDTPENSKDNIAYNRNLIGQFYGLSGKELCILKQVHSNKVIIVDHNWALNEEPEADSMVTKNPNLILAIQTADCVPILLADFSKNIIGAIHAGWKGARAGIIAKTVEAMIELGADLNHLVAAVGPAISQEHYEVGEEFYDDFYRETSYNAQFFRPSLTQAKYYFDLKAYVCNKLYEYISSVENLQLDTYADKVRFFSYRRYSSHPQEIDGRLLSTIVLKE